MPDGVTAASPSQGTAFSIAQSVQWCTFSARTVASDLQAVIDEREEKVCAFAYLDPAQLATQAASIDAGPKGPLAGVPVAIKDVIQTLGMPTAHNTARYRGVYSGGDAACVDRLRQAGAVIVGKTETTEFAATQAGPRTNNPHKLGHTPGGSSSGSAAAVAAGMAAIALGTQTGGSTIRPASYCGIFGWKPTWNSVSREGAKMYSATCDTIGFYARDAGDFMRLADLYEFEACDQFKTFEGLRVGVTTAPFEDKAGPETTEALDRTIAILRDGGATVEELPLPEGFRDLPEAHRRILWREGRSAFLNEVRGTPGIDPFFAEVVDGTPYDPADLRWAYRTADRVRAAFDETMEDFDLVLTPSATGPAPEGLENTGDPSFNLVWTLLQVPVVSVPMHMVGRLPVGVSLVARRYEDRRAIAAAKLLHPDPVAPVVPEP